MEWYTMVHKKQAQEDEPKKLYKWGLQSNKIQP